MESQDTQFSSNQHFSDNESVENGVEDENRSSETTIEETTIEETTIEEVAQSDHVLDLELVFFSESDSEDYFAEGKYDEAYGVLNRRNRLGLELRNVRYLLNYAVTLLATNEERKYSEVKDKLYGLFVKKHVTYDQMVKLAKIFQKRNKFIAVLVLLELSVQIFDRSADACTTAEFTADCVQNMKIAIFGATEKQEVMQHFLTRRFLPKMRILRESVENMVGLKDDYKCIKMAWLTHHIESCDSNDETRIVLLRGTVKKMKEVLGSTVNKHKIYGSLCNNLGSLYFKLGQNEEAIVSYNEALECLKFAEDFDNESERKKHIKGISGALQRAKGEPIKEEDNLQKEQEQPRQENASLQSALGESSQSAITIPLLLRGASQQDIQEAEMTQLLMKKGMENPSCTQS